MSGALLDQFVDAMFRYDRRGRLVGAAPLLHVVRTDDQVICRCHASLPDCTAADMSALAAAPRGRPGAWADDYARYLSLAADVSAVTSVRAGPLFRFPEDLPADPDCVAIDAGNAHLLEGRLDEWLGDVGDGALMSAVLAEGRAAAVCATVRASEHVHCAGVETAPAYRGRGMAGRAVLAWAGRVRERGAEPFYATTFDNLASQKVAQRLRLRLIGSEFSIYGAASRPSPPPAGGNAPPGSPSSAG